MGVDCIPRNKNVKPFHANWTCWYFLHQTLLLARADTSEMAGTNDGNWVSARTARKWARCLRRLLARKGPLRLRLAKYPDPHYSSGYNFAPVIDFQRAPLKERVLEKLKCGREVTIQDQVDWYAGRHIPPEQVELVELTKDHKKLLLEFADFCEKSSGFAQW